MLRWGSSVRRSNAAFALQQLKSPAAIRALARRLKDPSVEVRERIVLALESIQHRRAVAPLLNALQDESGAVRRYAAQALGLHDQPGIREALLQCLADPDFQVQHAAVESLCRLKVQTAVGAILNVIDQAIAEQRSTYAISGLLWKLEDVGDAESGARLARWLNHPEHAIRDRIVDTLRRLRWEPRDEHEELALAIAELEYEKAATHGTMAIDALVDALIDPESVRLAVTLEAGGSIDGSDLMNRRRDCYKTLEQVLGSLAPLPSSATNALVQSLSAHPFNHHLSERTDSILRLLGKLGDPIALECLQRFATSGNSYVQHEAMLSLVELRDARARPTLLKMLESGRKDADKLRVAAAIGLVFLREPSAPQQLAKAMRGLGECGWHDQRRKGMGMTAIRELAEFGETARSALESIKASEKIDSAWRDVAREVLRQLDAKRHTAEKAAYEQTRDDVRRRLFNDGAMWDDLVRMTDDSDPLVRRAVAEEIAASEDHRANGLLLKMLDDADSPVRLVVLRSVAERRIPDVESRIAVLLRSDEPAIRFATVKSLGAMKSPAAMDALAAYLMSKNRDHKLERAVAKELDCLAADATNTAQDERARKLMASLSQKNRFKPEWSSTIFEETPQGDEHLASLATLLKSSAAGLSLEVLTLASDLDGVSITLSNDCGVYGMNSLDCTPVRQMARQEILRRLKSCGSLTRSEAATNKNSTANRSQQLEPIVYACRCGKTYKVKAEHIGKRVKCQCGQSGLVSHPASTDSGAIDA